MDLLPHEILREILMRVESADRGTTLKVSHQWYGATLECATPARRKEEYVGACREGDLLRLRCTTPDPSWLPQGLEEACRYGRRAATAYVLSLCVLPVEEEREVHRNDLLPYRVFGAACEGGHRALAEWLLGVFACVYRERERFWAIGIRRAAKGCQLSLLSWIFAEATRGSVPEDRYLYRGVFEGACAGGHTDLALDITHRPEWRERFNEWDSAWIYADGVQVALLGGHFTTAKTLRETLQGGTLVFRDLLWHACAGGNRGAIQWILEGLNDDTVWIMGNNSADEGFAGACHGGHRDVAEWMLTRGATNRDIGFLNACRAGHLDLVEWLLPYGDVSDGFHVACIGGQRTVVQWFVERMVSVADVFGKACVTNNLYICKLIVRNCDIDDALQCGNCGRAIAGGHSLSIGNLL